VQAAGRRYHQVRASPATEGRLPGGPGPLSRDLPRSTPVSAPTTGALTDRDISQLADACQAGAAASGTGHLVNATAASAAEANNCRRADLAVIHPRCCHSRSASESPAITTSPNGMER
jgi:hypothetical protein